MIEQLYDLLANWIEAVGDVRGSRNLCIQNCLRGCYSSVPLTRPANRLKIRVPCSVIAKDVARSDASRRDKRGRGIKGVGMSLFRNVSDDRGKAASIQVQVVAQS